MVIAAPPAIVEHPQPAQPVITEVLYAVPGGDAGDANGDGRRHASGDEFVELFNPTDRPIELAGYELRDRNALGAGSSGAFRFVFPPFALPPGEFAVVFNGYGQAWRGPVGDARAAPAGRNEFFHDAWVFTADVRSSRVAFSSTDELVVLLDPAGTPLEAVVWGDPSPGPPPGTVRLEPVPRVRGASVQRDGPGGAFRGHADLDGLPCSPGAWAKSPAPDALESERGPPMAWITKDSAGATVERRQEPYLTDAMRRVLEEEIIPRYETRRAALLPALRLIQHEYHHIPYQAMEEIASVLDLAPAEVLDTASFYEEFWLRPRGRHLIAVCRSIACEVCGHRAVTDAVREHLGIEVGDTTEDGMFTLVEIECIGACGGAPAALIDETLIEPADPRGIVQAIERVRASGH